MKIKIRFATVAEICRLILAVVFIFSGFMKTIDPWGLAVKVPDLLEFFGFGWLSGWSAGLAIWLCAAELMMGFMLLFRVRLRLVSIFALVTMAGFTLLTLVIAIWNPLDDCGCFGDAIKVDNWMSFYKNLILFPMSVVVWYGQRGRRIFNFSRREIVLTVLFATLAGGLGIYCWRHLPPIDLFPYKVGTDVRRDVMCNRCNDSRIKLIYADRETGLEHEFELSDTTWYDSRRWEFVKTTTPYDTNPPKIADYDFALWRGGYNVADEIVFHEGTVKMIFIHDGAGGVSSGCVKALVPYLKEALAAGDSMVIFVMGTEVGEEAPAEYTVGGVTLPCYGMERALQQEMLRADAGLVEMRDGVITRKLNCKDL
jgi:uncharacterized membrane protein YphA (DoxX/SURF4 family)